MSQKVLFLPWALFQAGSLTSDIDFRGDRFCQTVFDSLWRKRENQTCIIQRDGFKYVDLRILKLKFGMSTQFLVRPEYERLEGEVIKVYEEKYLNESLFVRPRGVVVTGQPGIGKSAPYFQCKSFSIFNRKNAFPLLAPARTPLGW
jgi:hypothetical protein